MIKFVMINYGTSLGGQGIMTLRRLALDILELLETWEVFGIPARCMQGVTTYKSEIAGRKGKACLARNRKTPSRATLERHKFTGHTKMGWRCQ